MLEIENLMVFYENALAVNNISLRVEKGEIVGILGSNGAGKSTILNTVAGITLYRRVKEERRGGERITILGEVRFKGGEIGGLKPGVRVGMGLVLCGERHRVFPESSVLNNLKTAGYPVKRDEARAMMEYVFELFPVLERMKGRLAGFLSGGEQQMLSIGMAMVAGPELLLLDEPLLGLAPLVQGKVVEAMRRLRAEKGVTILVSEQYARAILPAIDRGYVIENGTLVLSGTGRGLMENPHVRSAYFGG